jgi:hypothetical protein
MGILLATYKEKEREEIGMETGSDQEGRPIKDKGQWKRNTRESTTHKKKSAHINKREISISHMYLVLKPVMSSIPL